MIPFNFIYFRPESLKESVDIFNEIQADRKSALYYSGGSEIITMCRSGSIKPDAVIDIKSIPECSLLSKDLEKLHIGSVCTLNQIAECRLFPLLGMACGRIADHTNQRRISLGGNLCGTIIYRETSLPLMVSDAEISLFGPEGERCLPFNSVFNGRLQLKAGEMITQIHLPLWALSARYYHIKKTANEKIDYPLVSIAAICKGNYLRAAFSGVCSHPFQSEQINVVLNDNNKSPGNRAEAVCRLLPESAYSDSSSGGYRLFVLKNTVQELLESRENAEI